MGKKLKVEYRFPDGTVKRRLRIVHTDPNGYDFRIETWNLDLFSTILSRKHSDHLLCGPVRYVKVKRTG